MQIDAKAFALGNALRAYLAGRGVIGGGEITAGPYLTFASAKPFTISVNNAKKMWEGILEYSTDTETWDEWDATTTIASEKHSGWQKIYMRGTGNTRISGDYYPLPSYHWVLTGSNIHCVGNIENLLDYQTVLTGNHPKMNSGCYGYLFYQCESLITAPELPATTLVASCYDSMFGGTGLTTAPELPATTMKTSCYRSMFSKCKRLITAPALPAKTMEYACYAVMFGSCESLVTAPELPATSLNTSCYGSMFVGCTSLKAAPKLPATNLKKDCYKGMFEGCTSLTALPKLSATNLATYCYILMFNGCTNIKLSAVKTEEYTVAYRIPATGSGTQDESVKNMFADTGGTFTGTPEINTTYYLHKDNSIV